MNQARDRIAGNTLLMRIASNLYMTMAAPVRPFSCNTGIKVTSAEQGSPAYVIRPLLWGRLFGRIQKQICDLRSYWFFTTETTEDPKKDHLRLLYTSVAYRFFFFRKTACQKCFFQILSPKKRSDRESQKYGFGFDPKNPPWVWILRITSKARQPDSQKSVFSQATQHLNG